MCELDNGIADISSSLQGVCRSLTMASCIWKHKVCGASPGGACAAHFELLALVFASSDAYFMAIMHMMMSPVCSHCQKFSSENTLSSLNSL